MPPPAAPLSIVGIRDHDRLRRPASSAEPLRLQLSALGGSGTRWWFLNGAPLAESQPGEAFAQVLRETGQYQLSVLDQGGQTAQLQFSVSE